MKDGDVYTVIPITPATRDHGNAEILALIDEQAAGILGGRVYLDTILCEGSYHVGRVPEETLPGYCKDAATMWYFVYVKQHD